jgi:hypothetical protein
MSPYFQRKLVWRDIHKSDFIDTILKHLPFPEIFIARGTIDIETMTSVSCVVDGQQRLNAIREFIEGAVVVDGLRYSDLDARTKAAFLKYEVAIIDLDINHDAPEVVDIFQRLNRTFYALSTIEKQATEYASSEFMLVAKLLANELRREAEEDLPDEDRAPVDPNLTPGFIDWQRKQKTKAYHSLLLTTEIFSKYEISRMVHLSFTLNALATLCSGYYNRNEKVGDLLDAYKDEFSGKDKVVSRLNEAAKGFAKLGLDKVPFWLRKANAFTALMVLDELLQADPQIVSPKTAKRMRLFAKNHSSEYALAAKEAVNNKRERQFRHEEVRAAVLG